jgi:transcriptional regulator with XRE-family HTH domain
MATFASRLKQLCEEAELSGSELGRLVGLSKQAISSYATGGSSPNNETLGRLADVFRVSVDYLLGRTDERGPAGVRESATRYGLDRMSTLNERFSARVKLLCDERGWVQEDLAQPLKVDRSAISKWRDGMPRPETLCRLSEVLDASLDYLLGLSDVRRPAGRRILLADLLPDMPADVREWLAGPGAGAYVLVAKDAADGEINAEALKSIVETIRHELIRAKKP